VFANHLFLAASRSEGDRSQWAKVPEFMGGPGQCEQPFFAKLHVGAETIQHRGGNPPRSLRSVGRWTLPQDVDPTRWVLHQSLAGFRVFKDRDRKIGAVVMN
jgi:hypothetical protein